MHVEIAMIELSRCSYPISLVRSCTDLGPKSGKGVYMHFKSLVEVLLDSLSDNDSACKRTE